MTTDVEAAPSAPSAPAVPGASPLPIDLESADVGLVHRLDDAVTGYDHPRLVAAYALLCDTAPVLGRTQDARAGALAEHRSGARAAALGEAIERYCAAYLPASRLHRWSPAEIATTSHVPPDWLDRGAQHPMVAWVSGHRLHPDRPAEPAWVAASRVYLAATAEFDEIAVPTSTGLACHPDPWQSLYSGLLEVIERDAVMVSWLTRSRPTPIRSRERWIGSGGQLIRFDRSIERYELYRLDSPTGIPVVLGVAYGAAGQPPVAVGAAADIDLARACRKALVEAHQTFSWTVLMVTEGRWPDTDPSDFTSLDEHVLHYLDPSRLDAFAYLRDSDRAPLTVDLDAERTPPGPARERVLRVLGALRDAGLDSYAVDVTTPDVRVAGLWVTRSVVPALYPLIVGAKAPDHPRVARSVAHLRDPHPFP